MDKKNILEAAKKWFRASVATHHISNTEKLINPQNFNINPFTTVYLANFLTGNSSPESIAKALLFPRVLGTSISTTFGNGIQQFTHDVLGAFGSTTHGIDIEFTDKIDGYKKYCQLKSGPNTINKDDVETIAGHFNGVIHLARTNHVRVTHGDMIVGVIYGEPHQLNGHYKRISSQYNFPIHTGKDFWHRLTGDEYFYHDLIVAIGSVAVEADYSHEFQDIIKQLAATETIQNMSNHN
ncbi:MAG: PmeII family type II restriction endonuclease [Mariprofundaceae bacterium]|nr:PmeII family type II restriction endonuclease [Mariprofundaceae bacterium]